MDENEFKRSQRGKITTREEDGRVVPGLDLGLAGRQVVRKRRCQNCSHFDTEEHFDSAFNACMLRDGGILRARGATEAVVQAHIAKMRKAILGRRGWVGHCLIRMLRTDKQAADDFTAAGYLCDSWSGAHGLTFPREEGPPDKLPDEILDDRGESQPARPGEEESES